MNKQQEQEKLLHAIRDLEGRLREFKRNLDLIEKEVDQLTTIEAQIEENLKFLRKKHIVALAQEYKKVREDLQKTQNRLAMIRIDRKNIRRVTAEVEQALNKCKAAYAENLKSPNNVLPFKGRSNGQE